ncbi:hypothetical protein JRQ81_009014 [Phrynocephalus forsythii]|uniref:Endosome-associated-trafficking regulator 1 n=1 Tax=Phrynocephalus forsythii TaxID=171643 RepID=A0A9Q0XEG4_9SAUR|nr:hypothetical protein JRQ81_009014 [Phrynocephalus forsythii]
MGEVALGILQASGEVGPPASPAEEANPFSFKEFVRSKNQNAAPTAAMTGAKGGGGAPLDVGVGTSASPKSLGPRRMQLHPVLVWNGSGFKENPVGDPYLQHPVSAGMLIHSLKLQHEWETPISRDGFGQDVTWISKHPFSQTRQPQTPCWKRRRRRRRRKDDWSSTYKPSAVEEAHRSRVPGLSLSSTFESYYGDSSDSPELPGFSPWQLGRQGGCLPQDSLPEADDSSPADADGAALPDSFYQPRLPSYDELRQENAKLRSKIGHVQAVSETQAKRINDLERTLEESKRKEEKEAHDLEAMVQQVEENLRLMTKRATKAESSVLRLKQENALLQVQVENYRLENEALKRGHLANLAVMKQNTDVALQNLLAVLSKSRGSIKQLVSSAEELQLVADLLKSIDKISELPEDSP